MGSAEDGPYPTLPVLTSISAQKVCPKPELHKEGFRDKKPPGQSYLNSGHPGHFLCPPPWYSEAHQGSWDGYGAPAEQGDTDEFCCHHIGGVSTIKVPQTLSAGDYHLSDGYQPMSLSGPP